MPPIRQAGRRRSCQDRTLSPLLILPSPESLDETKELESSSTRNKKQYAGKRERAQSWLGYRPREI